MIRLHPRWDKDQTIPTSPENIEIFDLKADPQETSDLAGQIPDKAAELKAIQDATWKAGLR